MKSSQGFCQKLDIVAMHHSKPSTFLKHGDFFGIVSERVQISFRLVAV